MFCALKHRGGGIVVWLCMMTKKVGHNYFQGHRNVSYNDVMENVMNQSTHSLEIGEEFVFQ